MENVLPEPLCRPQGGLQTWTWILALGWVPWRCVLGIHPSPLRPGISDSVPPQIPPTLMEQLLSVGGKHEANVSLTCVTAAGHSAFLGRGFCTWKLGIRNPGTFTSQRSGENSWG